MPDIVKAGPNNNRRRRRPEQEQGMSSTEVVSAKLTMHLEASTGYSADCSATISPEQWGALNAIVHGKPTKREKQVVAALRDVVEIMGSNGLDECEAYVAASSLLEALDAAGAA